jgi:hypothetical protein
VNDVQIHPGSPEGREARKLALRLIAARLGAGRVEKAAPYEEEFNRIIETDDRAGTANLLHALTDVVWALVVLAGTEEGREVLSNEDRSPEDLLALVEKMLDELTP